MKRATVSRIWASVPELDFVHYVAKQSAWCRHLILTDFALLSER